MSLRAEIWCAAFVRRHNNLGSICVISRRGDPIAGQVWVEVDHLDGNSSLFCPAPRILLDEDDDTWRFECRLDRVSYDLVKKRVDQEAKFDPDFWLLTLESRKGDYGLEVVPTPV